MQTIEAVHRSVLPYVCVSLCGESCCALLDSGSMICAIREKFFVWLCTLNKKLKLISSEVKCFSVNGVNLNLVGYAMLSLRIGKLAWKFKFFIFKDLNVNVILGADFMAKAGLILNAAENSITFRFEPNYVLSCCSHSSGTVKPVLVSSHLSAFSLDHLSLEQGAVIKSLCESFSDVLSDKLGVTHLLKYRIILSDNIPVKQSPYRLSPPRMNILKEIVNEMLEEGIIRPSVSPYAAPIFLVPKADGGHRPVVDYRLLNKKVVLESIPLPDIHSCFSWFGKAKFFSSLDLNKAYHQIALEEDSKHVTAFATDWNLYEFNRVPFGLATGAAVLSRLLDHIFSDFKFKFVFHYLDDLVVFSNTFEEHVDHLNKVLGRLRNAGLTVKPSKVSFARDTLSFLGHVVSEKGVSVDHSRIQSVLDFPQPRDVKGISRFIGMINFFRKFIPNFAQRAAPLNCLRRKGVKFLWGPSQEAAFQDLKLSLCSAPVLAIPDFNREFIIQTDASSSAVGAVLLQESELGRSPIAYASRTLSSSEGKFSIYELEALAVLFALEKFRYYVEHVQFRLETDNQALSWVLARPRRSGRLARWATRISAFKFEVHHIRSSQNIIADSLSRMFSTDLPQDLSSSEPDSLQEESILQVGAILSELPLLFKDIALHQKEDPVLEGIRNRISDGNVIKPYSLVKGILCCIARHDNKLKIVVPKALTAVIFRYFHESPLGGHLGVFKTREKIRESFIWKNMDLDIRNWIKHCHACLSSKPSLNTRMGLLSSSSANKPMERLFIDFLGPLPRTRGGNKFILVCVDGFSRFIWLFPTRNANAETVISCLKNIFASFGPARIIVSDNAKAFSSVALKQFCVDLFIRHVTTTPYYPNPSLAERVNRNLRAALIAFHGADHSKWDSSLHWLSLAFNCAAHESLKFSPFSIMFGFFPNSPLNNLWDIDSILPDVIDPTALKNVWRDARENLKVAFSKREAVYNRNRKAPLLSVGDHVFVENHFPASSAAAKFSLKLAPRFRGPCEILKFLTPVTLLVRDPDNKVSRVHLSQTKPV